MRHGFLEAALRAAGRRPGRWFAVVWAALVGAWVLVGLVGFSYKTQPDVPPPPAAVPYHDWMVGGANHDQDLAELSTHLASQDLPPFDKALDDPRRSFTIWSDAQGRRRLVCQFKLVEVAFGWPHELAHWRVFATYDVTDAARPFARMPNPHWDRLTSWRHDSVLWIRFSEDRLEARSLSLQWLASVQAVLACELMAALLVLVLWSWYAVRQRRRGRQGLCLSCGYRHSAPEAVCPECGTAAPAKVSQVRRPVRFFLSMWAVAIAAWAIASVLVARPTEYPPMSERMAELVREAEESPMGQSASSLMMDEVEYGWPARVLNLWVSQTFVCERGSQPYAAPRPSTPGFGSYEQTWKWGFATDDPSRHRSINLHWSVLLGTVAVLQVPAVLLAAIVGAVGAAVRRARRRSD